MEVIKSKAEYEFEILEKTVEGPIIGPFKAEILAIVKKFEQSGQSGGSAPFTAGAISDAIKKLCLEKPICDITGIDEEWNECSLSKGVFQNNRLTSVFKDGKNNKAHFLNAIVFKGQNGGCFTTGGSVNLKDGSKIGSSHYIKDFPFKAKTFYIDVVETEWRKDKETGKLTKEDGGGWWTSIVKDESQLKEVFEYYDRKLIKSNK